MSFIARNLIICLSSALYNVIFDPLEWVKMSYFSHWITDCGCKLALIFLRSIKATSKREANERIQSIGSLYQQRMDRRNLHWTPFAVGYRVYIPYIARVYVLCAWESWCWHRCGFQVNLKFMFNKIRPFKTAVSAWASSLNWIQVIIESCQRRISSSSHKKEIGSIL